MWVLPDADFDNIVRFLRGLPPRDNPSVRSECWRTAEELLPLVQTQGAAITWQQLDDALCRQFSNRQKLCPIRPAYYPGENTCKRLWGHKINVKPGPGDDALLQKLNTKPRPLEADELEASAPTVFLSHAMEDHHLAARVRLNLARHRIRSWIAEGELHEGTNLFEAVEGALQRCDALIVLISSVSISSAWLYTEISTALGSGKNILPLADSSDDAICDFLSRWVKERDKQSAHDWLRSEAPHASGGFKQPSNTRSVRLRSQVSPSTLTDRQSGTAPLRALGLQTRSTARV